MSSDIKIHLCGPASALIQGKEVAHQLSGQQGRTLVGFLVLNRCHSFERETLIHLLWPSDSGPKNPESDLTALLSKLKKVFGQTRLITRGHVHLKLPHDAWIDVEIAQNNLHVAESQVAKRNWADAWAPAQVASHIYARPFLQGLGSAWVMDQRERFRTLEGRALESLAACSYHMGGVEYLTAERAARRAIEIDPYRESAWRLLMLTLLKAGNKAEAIYLFAQLSKILKKELDISPSTETVQVHKTLLAS